MKEVTAIRAIAFRKKKNVPKEVTIITERQDIVESLMTLWGYGCADYTLGFVRYVEKS